MIMSLTQRQSTALHIGKAVAELNCWSDLAHELSCTEAEAISALITMHLGNADQFLTCHAHGDDDYQDLHEADYDDDGSLVGWHYRIPPS